MDLKKMIFTCLTSEGEHCNVAPHIISCLCRNISNTETEHPIFLAGFVKEKKINLESTQHFFYEYITQPMFNSVIQMSLK